MHPCHTLLFVNVETLAKKNQRWQLKCCFFNVISTKHDSTLALFSMLFQCCISLVEVLTSKNVESYRWSFNFQMLQEILMSLNGWNTADTTINNNLSIGGSYIGNRFSTLRYCKCLLGLNKFLNALRVGLILLLF